MHASCGIIIFLCPKALSGVGFFSALFFFSVKKCRHSNMEN
jgi:hypothetical protein